MRAYSSLRLAVMAMSQQSLPPVNQYTGSYTEDVGGADPSSGGGDTSGSG